MTIGMRSAGRGQPPSPPRSSRARSGAHSPIRSSWPTTAAPGIRSVLPARAYAPHLAASSGGRPSSTCGTRRAGAACTTCSAWWPANTSVSSPALAAAAPKGPTSISSSWFCHCATGMLPTPACSAHEVPYWFGMKPVGGLSLGTIRFLGDQLGDHDATARDRRTEPLPAGGRIRHGLVVYDGGQG